ncbi:MAG: nitroreductase family protein [Candidatus Cloacimonetes bacterium]|nr:nitroreductase family protein [Candidatus Cloacimonadota bacterium]
MILDIVLQNRSYRRFLENKRLSYSELSELISIARFTPSAANLQNIRYFLIDSVPDCEAIFPHLKWASYLQYWNGPEQGERPVAYILVLAPTNTTKFHHIDTGIAAQTILLAAVDKGFGGCMLASIDKVAVHELFSLPSNLDIVLAIALGYPAEKVEIEDVTDPDDVEYWRDEDDCHHVPKRRLKDLIINRKG